jgi:hypothetical protein
MPTILLAVKNIDFRFTKCRIMGRTIHHCGERALIGKKIVKTSAMVTSVATWAIGRVRWVLG